MRTTPFILALLVVLDAPIAQAQGRPLTDAQREEMRKRADELNAKNAREREEIQRGFAPSRPNVTARQAAPSAAQICKATIAALMGRSPEIITVAREDNGVIFLAYQRPSDKSLWRNRCKVNGSTVIWASDPGRWRDHPQDEKVSFEFKAPDQVTIRQRHSDGSGNEKSFSTKEL